MNKSGRLIVVKSVASAVPIYTLMANNLPAWAIDEIDAICRNFLWTGGEQSARGKCSVAWPIVCRLKELGGLGIADLRLTGIALQSKWLWLQKTDQDRAWSSLDIKVSSDVHAFFAISVLAILGNGMRIKFWEDNWMDGTSIQHLAPNLVRLVPAHFRANRTVAQALMEQRWTRDITNTLNPRAIQELDLIWDIVQGAVLQDREDQFIWRWSTNGQYSAQSAYRALQSGSIPIHGVNLIWNSWAPLKVKMFLWLAVHRRHWTAERRIRHGLQSHTNCLLCDQELETIEHILVRCSYAQQIWWLILQHLGFVVLIPGNGSIQEWWHQLRNQLLSHKRKGFDSLFALITWQLWKERNARLFRDAVSTPLQLLGRIKREGDDWIAAGAQKLGSLFCE
ncbi:unnamed protein product [Urochloa decumbens]|uniref:Reverse transcriptase zinc-binding domain-containing protein n=1 Tax=Urochloa decumbens TaxID=240449 RepID=A0ABC9DNB9_9POAL